MYSLSRHDAGVREQVQLMHAKGWHGLKRRRVPIYPVQQHCGMRGRGPSQVPAAAQEDASSTLHSGGASAGLASRNLYMSITYCHTVMPERSHFWTTLLGN